MQETEEGGGKAEKKKEYKKKLEQDMRSMLVRLLRRCLILTSVIVLTLFVHLMVSFSGNFTQYVIISPIYFTTSEDVLFPKADVSPSVLFNSKNLTNSNVTHPASSPPVTQRLLPVSMAFMVVWISIVWAFKKNKKSRHPHLRTVTFRSTCTSFSNISWLKNRVTGIHRVWILKVKTS